MFPYSSIYNPFPYTNHTMPENPNLPHTSQLPTLLQDDGLLLSHLLSQQQLLAGTGTAAATSQADHTETSFLGWNQAVDHMNKGILRKKKSCSESGQTTIPRKRSGKKDRHSKICTAQGPRDRRMRLSLQIARKFFDLQDMLGFDKASKTIDWLFNKSKTAIKELKCCKIGAQSSSTSDQSEVVSTAMESEFFSSVKEKKNRKLCMVGKESRDKARARARERTRVKMKIRGDLENSRRQYTDQTGTKDSSSRHLWESKSLETSEESRRHCNREMNYSLKMVTEAEEPAVDIELPDELVGSVKVFGLISDDHDSQQQIAVSSGPNFEDDFLGFPGNWDGNYDSKLQQSFSCTMTNTRRFTTTGNDQVQNPCAIFMAYSDTTQEEKPSSILLTTSDTSQELNPSSVFMTSSTLNIADHEKNPSSNLVNTPNIFWQSQFFDNQFTCNPTISNTNHISY